ncbi:MAG: hypothetical protein U9O49_02425 [Candidatus Thermoplasmatota archaeon]|nr:hypothetical protein [Candidatus Thermoplasmatota archaeon]
MVVLPTVSVNEGFSSPIFYDMSYMSKSNDTQIYGLFKGFQSVSYVFLTIIAFGLLSEVGIVIYASGKNLVISKIILLASGIVTTISSIFVVFLYLILVREVQGFQVISMAKIASTPVAYSYLPIAASFASVLSSLLCLLAVSLFCVKGFKEAKLHRKIKKKTIPKKQVETNKPKKTEIREEPSADASRQATEEVEEWLKGEIKHLESYPEKEIESEESETMAKDISEIGQDEKIEPRKVVKSPFSPDKKIEDTGKEIVPESEEYKNLDDSEEIPISKEFEEALSSAVQKRHKTLKNKGNPKIVKKSGKSSAIKKEKKKATESGDKSTDKIMEKESKDLSEKNDDQEVNGLLEQVKEDKAHDKEKISVKCPQCKHIFEVEKQGNVTKIKCPKCGKEGVARG